LEGVPKAAQSKGLRLEVLKASTESEIDAAFAALGQLQAGALIAGTDAFFTGRREQIVGLAVKHANPAIYDDPAFTEAGGLMTYRLVWRRMPRVRCCSIRALPTAGSHG
jgi:hypothetical protein